MAARSIGALTLFINGEAAGLMKTFNQVDNRIARASRSFTKPGAKLALGFLGVQNALSAVSGEVRHVIANIENIPGVPATTISSVVTLRENLAGAKNWIDQMTASVVGFGAEFAQAVGVGAAAMMGYGDSSGLSAIQSPDEIAAAGDPAYYEKLQTARKRFVDSQKEAEMATKSEAEQIKMLREEAQRFETFSESGNRSMLERIQAKTTAQEKLAEANKKLAALNKELSATEKEVAKSMTGSYVATLSTRDAIAGLEQRTQSIFIEMAKVGGDKNDPASVQRRIELNRELAQVQEALGKQYEKQGQLGREAGNLIAGGFEDALLSGEKLSDTLKQLALDLAKLLIRNQITGPLAGWLGGLFTGGKGLAKPAADGGYRDGTKPYLIGERGPEMFYPGVSGTVVPNHALGGGDTFHFGPYHFGSGVQAQQLMPMLQLWQRDTLAKIADSKRRRSSLGRAL